MSLLTAETSALVARLQASGQPNEVVAVCAWECLQETFDAFDLQTDPAPLFHTTFPTLSAIVRGRYAI